jgi:hypothetical protein
MKAVLLRLILIVALPFGVVAVICMDWRNEPWRSVGEFVQDWADAFKDGVL